MIVRPLEASDRPSVDAFLAGHRDSSMLLRGNINRVGLEYGGRRFEAEYAGALENEQLVGLAGHCWNGMLLVQAPACVDDVVAACVARSQRRVTGLAGPALQVRRAVAILGLADTPRSLDADEGLYGLDLDRLVVPPALMDGTVQCRPPRSNERDLLSEWRFAYDVESLGSPASPETRERTSRFLDAQIADGNAWVAVHDERLVSLSAFNAALPDMVQLGGIYTPPEFRRRGFARAAVAKALLVARERGVSRAVLFTDNAYAVRSYEAVGFERIGDFGLILFR